MLTESRTHTTRTHHSSPPHSAPKHRARGKHGHRSVVPHKGTRHTHRGHTHPAVHRRRVSHMDRLTTALTNRVKSATLTTQQGRGALVNNLVQDINQQKKELRKYYSCDAVMLAILEGRLDEWLKRTVRSLKKTLSRADLRQLQASLQESFQHTIASMEVTQPHIVTTPDRPRAIKETDPLRNVEEANPTHTVTEETPPRDAHETGETSKPTTTPRAHKPRKKRRSRASKKHRGPKFYLEEQEEAQCGRHAINMFYQKDVLPYRRRFNGMCTYNMQAQMHEVEKLKGKNRNIVLLNYQLTDSVEDAYGNKIYYDIDTPRCVDELPIKRMLLSAGGHHVCFFKYKKEWYLLNSQNSQAVKMTPSAYIDASRRHHSQQELNQMERKHKESKICRHCKKSKKNPSALKCKSHEEEGPTSSSVHILCFDKGHEYGMAENAWRAITKDKGKIIEQEELRRLQEERELE